MQPRFHIPPLGPLARYADAIMLPIMRSPLVSFPGESPQLTHWWNNVKASREATEPLYSSYMVACKGDPNALPRTSFWDFRFHCGGWPKYVVLEPYDGGETWYVGWRLPTWSGASQVPINGKVRVLIGPDDVEFFGVRFGNCEQIRIREVGSGVQGDESGNSRITLR